MRKCIFLFLVILSVSSSGQRPDSVPAADQTHRKLKLSDTTIAKPGSPLADTLLKIQRDLDQKRWEEQNLQGLNYLMEQQKARRAKEKRNAIIRIGIGVLFLGVLIVGLRRRTKNKDAKSPGTPGR